MCSASSSRFARSSSDTDLDGLRDPMPVEIHEMAKSLLWGDRLLRQVFDNLIENAVQAMGDPPSIRAGSYPRQRALSISLRSGRREALYWCTSTCRHRRRNGPARARARQRSVFHDAAERHRARARHRRSHRRGARRRISITSAPARAPRWRLPPHRCAHSPLVRRAARCARRLGAGGACLGPLEAQGRQGLWSRLTAP